MSVLIGRWKLKGYGDLDILRVEEDYNIHLSCINFYFRFILAELLGWLECIYMHLFSGVRYKKVIRGNIKFWNQMDRNK